ncbi:MAG TPA: bifunctional aminotransferase class I/II-fold pyridoxal phosphate-dependent enzyme/GNAT family N-acetyltransferase [Myxococcota bacterium]|nr:bifunctional aminotransferase class I/II-fold pyridoxal phosphate-dependent enzyme/GNAT family N-acetyltransferase [Myxococcota bacterium]
MEVSEYLETVSAMHAEGRTRGLFFQYVDDEHLSGRHVRMDGRDVVSWASCSYLGLEFHPDLIRGVCEAVTKYGAQFSSSRGYLSSPQYQELEGLLEMIFGGSVVVAPTTTLAHQAALGSLVSERDAIVFDHQVHASVQVAATLARAQGARVEMVRHGDLGRAAESVRRLARTSRTVWVLGDGVYSMYGDLAPTGLLRELLGVADNVRLYIDDAHGMSWAGLYGRGSFLSRMPLSRRVTVATSFAKGFGSGGACVVFGDRAEADRMRMCGGPMLFSGPLQPPTLGALIASSRIHLSAELVERQEDLRRRIDLANRLIVDAGLPMLAVNESPIFFIRMGTPAVAMAVAERMLADGHLVNVSMYPSVPLKRAGLRLAMTQAHSFDDVQAVVASLAHHVPATFAALGVARRDVDALFDGAAPRESLISERYRDFVTSGVVSAGGAPSERIVPAWERLGLECDPAELRVEHRTSILDVDRSEWDTHMGGVAHCSWEAQLAVESVFRDQPLPEHNWRCHYLMIRDPVGRLVGMTFFTVALHKDDMLMRAEVSMAIEERRQSDPYFLSSLALLMGSGLSEGNHLWLDPNGPWRAVVHAVLREAAAIGERAGTGMLMVRDLPSGDAEMDALMLREGLVRMETLPTHQVEITWRDDEGMVEQASRRMRKHVQEILERDSRFEFHVYAGGAVDARATLDTAWLMRLYRNVAEKKFRLNMFFMPDNLLDGLLRSPAWEIVTLTLRPEAGGDGRPVAMYVAHRYGQHYSPLIVGLDYRHVFTEKTYRALLVKALRRAAELGMTVCHMGMDAEVEKLRLGASAARTCAYVQVRDHYNAAMMHEVVAEVGLQTGGPDVGNRER